MGKNIKIDWANIARYREEFISLREKGMTDNEIRIKWGIAGYGSFYKLKKMILQSDTLPPQAHALEIKPKKKYKKAPKAVSYQQMPIETKSDKPIFCLVVAFDSKEAAFKALGQL